MGYIRTVGGTNLRIMGSSVNGIKGHAAGAAALVLLLVPRVVWAQPGGPAVLDLEAFQEPLETWEQVAYGGTAETARYGLYQIRQRPLFTLYWRQLSASEHAIDRVGALNFLSEAFDPEYRLSVAPTALREFTHLDHAGWMYARHEPGEAVAERALVWPCPVSGRLFAAELTIDTTLETDPGWLSVLQAIASSVACHGPVRRVERADLDLGEVFRRDDLRLGLRVPAAWEAGLLDPGSTAEQGSVWAATTRSVGMVLLRRRDDRSGSLQEFLQTTVELLPVALARENRTVQVVQERERRAGNEWTTRGTFRVKDRDWGWISGEHRFMILAFGAVGEQHAILVSWLATPESQGMSLELTTPWQLVERLLSRAGSAYTP